MFKLNVSFTAIVIVVHPRLLMFAQWKSSRTRIGMILIICRLNTCSWLDKMYERAFPPAPDASKLRRCTFPARKQLEFKASET